MQPLNQQALNSKYSFISLVIRMSVAENLKSVICQTIDKRLDCLNEISEKIWNHPQLCFEEVFAHDLLTDFLEKEGFEVSKKTPIDTSFIAKYGKNDGMKVGVLLEYDALPGIGHACGHNLIAEAGVAAALGISATFHLQFIKAYIFTGYCFCALSFL